MPCSDNLTERRNATLQPPSTNKLHPHLLNIVHHILYLGVGGEGDVQGIHRHLLLLFPLHSRKNPSQI